MSSNSTNINTCSNTCDCGCKSLYVRKNKRDKDNIKESNLERTIYVYKMSDGKEKVITYKHNNSINKGKWSDETNSKQKVKAALEYINSSYNDNISVMRNWYEYKELFDKDNKPIVSYGKFLPLVKEANKKHKEYTKKTKDTNTKN